MKLRESKGHDYANLDNIHLNFDTIALLCKTFKVDVTTPEGCAFFDLLMKVQRISNLIFSGKEPKNEAVVDTVLDLANYNDILLEILVREGKIII